LTIIYRARILVAMNSMYSTLLVLRIAGLSSSGLVMRRLLFRTMTINNVVLSPSTILRGEFIIPSMAIATTAIMCLVMFIRLRYYRSQINLLDSWNRSIGTIDQTLILIEATLYCQEWSCSNIIPTIDKNVNYLYNLEYWSISSLYSSEWSSCVFSMYSGIWLTLGLVSILVA
jgi:hypothetical protein